jgi:hypothetical protein
MRFVFLAMVMTPVVVFWIVTPCEPVGGYRRLGGMILQRRKLLDYTASQSRKSQKI